MSLAPDVAESSRHTTEESRKASWEQLWIKRKRLHVYRNVAEEAQRCLQNIRGTRILEVGCGRGATALQLAQQGAQVVGLDYAQTAISTCEALCNAMKLEGSAEFLLGDARRLPFDHDSFDFVYSIGLLEHFEQPDVLLAEQCRVLKPGGFVLVQVPQKFSVYTLAKIPLTKLGYWPYGGWETQFSATELRKLLLRTGFGPVSIFGYGSFTLALLRHFFFPNLDYDVASRLWKSTPRMRALRAHLALDVGVVARKN